MHRPYLSRNCTIGSSVHCICSPSIVLLDCSCMLSSHPLSLMFPSPSPRECTYIFSTYAFFFCWVTQTHICLQEYIPVHAWLSLMKVTLGHVHVQLRFVWRRWPPPTTCFCCLHPSAHIKVFPALDADFLSRMVNVYQIPCVVKFVFPSTDDLAYFPWVSFLFSFTVTYNSTLLSISIQPKLNGSCVWSLHA